MINNCHLNSWLRETCLQHFAAMGVLCWLDGDNFWFNYHGIDAMLWLAALPNPFWPAKEPPVCCLGIPARMVTLYRSEITDSAEMIGTLLEELLDELKDWS